MQTRRSFLKTSSVLSAGLFMVPSEFKLKNPVIGLQLYTVRDAMDKDPVATLAHVAKLDLILLKAPLTPDLKNFMEWVQRNFKSFER